MKRGHVTALLSATIVVGASACSSDSDSGVQITAVVDYDANVPNFEDNRGVFTAEGDICAEGTFSNTGIEFVQGDPNRLTSRYQYNCADGSGLFFVLATVEADVEDFETLSGTYGGTWEIEEGAGLGDYGDAAGSGTFTGQISPDWVDELEGEFSK